MPVPITCPHCRSTYEVDDSVSGRRVRCKDCDSAFRAVADLAADEQSADRLHLSPSPPVGAEAGGVAAPEPGLGVKKPAGRSRRGLVLGTLASLALIAGAVAAAWYLLVPVILGPPALRYRWRGVPLAYRVRVEADWGKFIEVTDGTCVLDAQKDDRSTGWMGERIFTLTYRTTAATVRQQKGDGPPPGPQPTPPTTASGSMPLDAAGRHPLDRGTRLFPYLLGDMVSFLLIPLPDDGHTTWYGGGICPVAPASRFGGNGRPVPAFGYTLGGSRMATEQAVYTRSRWHFREVVLHQHYEMKMPPAGTAPGAELVGDGTITFAIADGVPRALAFTGTYTGADAPAPVPLTVTYTLLAGEERDAALRPPPAAPTPPPVPGVAVNVTELLRQLKDESKRERERAVRELARGKVEADRRAEVSRALAALLADADESTVRDIVRALAVWGDRQAVPALLPLVEDPSVFVRHQAIETLGRLNDERAAEPIARRLVHFGDQHEAEQALRQLGPKAEMALHPLLRERDSSVRSVACRLLEQIGTERSKAVIEQATTDPDPFVQSDAAAALRAITARR
ncbi:MAG: HEAT repeat domain-containing protein [Gemmataceae bacterium]